MGKRTTKIPPTILEWDPDPDTITDVFGIPPERVEEMKNFVISRQEKGEGLIETLIALYEWFGIKFIFSFAAQGLYDATKECIPFEIPGSAPEVDVRKVGSLRDFIIMLMEKEDKERRN